MEDLLKSRDTIYFLVFLASFGGSALLVKHNVNELIEDRENFRKRIDELEDMLVNMENKNKLTDKELMEIFATKYEMKDKISCVKEKINSLHELVEEICKK